MNNTEYALNRIRFVLVFTKTRVYKFGHCTVRQKTFAWLVGLVPVEASVPEVNA